MKLASTFFTSLLLFAFLVAATPVIRRQAAEVPGAPTPVVQKIVHVLEAGIRPPACNQDCAKYDEALDRLEETSAAAETFKCNNTLLEDVATCLRCGIAQHPNVTSSDLQLIQDQLDLSEEPCRQQGLSVEIPNIMTSGGTIKHLTVSLLGVIGALSLTFISI